MAIAIDGTNSATSTGSTLTQPLTTTQANDLIILFVKTAAVGDGVVSTVVDDGPGLTWTRRKSQSWQTGNAVLEEWYAISPGIFNANIIVTMTLGSASPKRTIAIGISGADTVTPFDTNASVPYGVFGASGTTSLGAASNITTNNANDMLLISAGNNNGMGTITRPSGFNNVVSTGTAHDVSVSVVSSIQTGVNNVLSWSTASTNGAVGIWDAIRAAVTGGPLVANGVTTSSVTSTTLTVSTTAATGGTGPYNYQFQRAPDVSNSPGTFVNIGPNSSSLSFNDTGLTASTKYWYRVVVTDSLSATANGASSTVTTGAVSPVASGTASLTSTDDNTVSVSSTAASGGIATITYQWYRSTVPNQIGSPVSGATSLTLVDAGLTNGIAYYYTLTATDGNTSANSRQIAGIPNKTWYAGLIGDSWNNTTCTTASSTAVTGPAGAGNILRDKIQASFNDGSKVIVNNQGIGGTNGSQWLGGTSNLTNALASFLTAKSPASEWIVAIHLGVNDSSINFSNPSGGESGAQFQTYIANICAAILAWGARGVVVHLPPFIGDVSANHNALGIKLLLDYHTSIKNVVALNPGKVFIGADEFNYFINNQSDLGGDKVHPTPSNANGVGGAINVATMWAKAIHGVMIGRTTKNTHS